MSTMIDAFTSISEDSGPLRGSTPPRKTSKRAKSGCLTCRIRKKRCDEHKPICSTCSRLGINCLGYDARRPEWLREDSNITKTKSALKQKVSEGRARRMREHWALEHGRARQSRSDDTGDSNETQGDAAADPVPADTSPNTILNILPDTSYPDLDPDLDQLLAMPNALAQPVDINIPDEMNDNAENDLDTLDLSWAIRTPDDVRNDSLAPLAVFTSALLANSNTPGMNQSVWPSIGEFPNSWITPDPTEIPSLTAPILSLAPMPTVTRDNVRYLHHYLNVILPLQFRFDFATRSDFFLPIACQNTAVLDCISGLAALHMAAQRRTMNQSPSNSLRNLQRQWPFFYLPDAINNEPDSNTSADPDLAFARAAHLSTFSRLRNLSATDQDIELSSSGTITAALCLTSYHCFAGGTGTMWAEAINLCRRSLSAMESLDKGPSPSSQHGGILEQIAKGNQLVTPLMWADVIASVTLNRSSKFLPIYRTVMRHGPIEDGIYPADKVFMETVMGCDSTTALAIAETVALAEWKNTALDTDSLGIRDLLDRARPIDELLEERSWREVHIIGRGSGGGQTDLRKLSCDIFAAAARVLLAVTLNGPSPRVSEVAAAVRKTIAALRQLESYVVLPDKLYEQHRALVFPITIAGCHADGEEQENFFRSRFARLGKDAVSFGNTGSALELMEMVWRLRREKGIDPGQRTSTVDWREVMKSLGWGDGLLLI